MENFRQDSENGHVSSNTILFFFNFKSFPSKTHFPKLYNSCYAWNWFRSRGRQHLEVKMQALLRCSALLISTWALNLSGISNFQNDKSLDYRYIIFNKCKNCMLHISGIIEMVVVHSTSSLTSKQSNNSHAVRDHSCSLLELRSYLFLVYLNKF